MAKLCALREKDRNFVTALIDAGLVDPERIDDRLTTVPESHAAAVEAAHRWLTSIRKPITSDEPQQAQNRAEEEWLKAEPELAESDNE